MRPDGKARRPSISGICEGGATRPAGMQRRSNAGAIFTTGCYARRSDGPWGPTFMSIVALSELLGASVRDASGTVRGRVREVAVTPEDHPTRVAYLIVRTADGERVLPAAHLKSCGASVRADTEGRTWDRY